MEEFNIWILKYNMIKKYIWEAYTCDLTDPLACRIMPNALKGNFYEYKGSLVANFPLQYITQKIRRRKNLYIREGVIKEHL